MLHFEERHGFAGERLINLTLRILAALVLGLGIGTLLAATSPTALPVVLGVAEPVGGIWLDCLRMTIVPLVFGLIVTGIASVAGTVAAGGVAARALLIFALLLIGAAALSAILAPLLLAFWPVPPGAREAFQTGLGTVGAPDIQIPPAAEWVRQLIPANPIGAAAEGAMLQVVIFALFFGFAMSRIEEHLRVSLILFFEALVRTMLVIVHWVLLAAPIGVFALAMVVGARAGLGAAGGLIHYVCIIAILCTATILSLYVWAALSRRIAIGDFARAAAPAQLVAFSTQSSLASLPAMVEGTRRHLKVRAAVSNLVLPLAVSLFRITSPTANLGVAIYLAHLYGVPLTLFTLVGAALVAVVVSLASVGLPSQVSFFSVVAPVCLALGVPVEMLGLLLAVETIPDIFRTVGNVTGDVAATAIAAPDGETGA